MNVPEGAVLEADLGGVAIWNVAALLPTHKTKAYEQRLVSGITHLFVHHSGRLGRPGFEGLLNSTRYVVQHRGFPGCAYHLWAPFGGERDEEDRLVVFRANAVATRSWHTGGALNGFGESLVLQGNTTTNGVSESQREILEAVLPYRRAALVTPGVTPTLSWHSEADRHGGRAKAACPGKAAVAWLTNYRYSSDWAGHPVVESVS